MEVLFAKRLRELRKEKGLSQVKLGKELGYGYTAIANYESGRNEPGYADLIRICEALDTTADYLLGISDVRKPSVVMEQNDLVCLYNCAVKMAKQCRKYL